jgi:hypothetical protein
VVLQGEFVVCNQKTGFVGVLKLTGLEIYVNYLQIKKIDAFDFLCEVGIVLSRYDIQDSQCTYNVTMRSVRATIVAVEKQYVQHILHIYVILIPRVCVCSLRYPACNAHARYFHLW